jgi:hypothetical protein
MKPGTSGLFGGGIYFAMSPEIAVHKAAFDRGHNAMMIVAEVDLGTAVLKEGEYRDLTLAKVRREGGDSVKGRSAANKEWEYVVYEPSRVKVIRAYMLPPMPNKRRNRYKEPTA